jgi:hypothetical protein
MAGGSFMPGTRLQNKVKQMLYKPNKNKIFKALNFEAVRERGEAMDRGREIRSQIKEESSDFSDEKR